jgi:hypothetical protein
MVCYFQPGPKGTAEKENTVSDNIEGQEPIVAQEPVQAPAAPEGNSPQPTDPPAPQGNPFWSKVEESVGPNVYKVIQPYLAEADTKHREGIEAVNSRFKPFQPFIDQGVSPDTLTQAMQLARQLNEAPEVIYEKLGAFLQQTGRMPSPAELQQEIDEDATPVDEDPRESQIRDLQGQLEQLQGFVGTQYEQQQQQQLAQEADSWLEGEASKMKQAHPDFTDDDVKEVYRIALGQVQQGQAPDLETAITHFTGLRDRFRSAPRAAASAPAVPGGAGGGTPNLGTQIPAKMTAAERQAKVVAMLGNQ